MLAKLRRLDAVLAVWLLAVPAARAAEDPLALLSRVQSAYEAAESLTAEVTLTRHASGASTTVSLRGTVTLEKPGKARLELAGPFGRTVVSDGTNVWTVIAEAKRCLKHEVVHPRTLRLLGAKPLSLFFAEHGFVFGLPVAPDSTRLLAPQKVGNLRCEVVEVTSKLLGRQRIRYFIGPDRLVRRMEAELEVGGQQVKQEVELREIRINPPVRASSFQFVPPPGFRVQTENPGKPLVAAGDIAPEFAFREVEGRAISLAASLRHSRAVWLSFWFRHCAPCVAEFPQLSRLYGEYQAQGLEIISINASDSVEDISKFKREKHVRFPMVSAGLRGARWNLLEVSEYGVLEDYDVRAFPTNLILDRQGRVVLRLEGFDEVAIRKGLSAAGLGVALHNTGRSTLAEPDSPANRDQPFRPGTKRTSVAAGPGR